MIQRCDDVEILIERHLAKALPDDEVVFMQAHLTSCTHCAAYLEAASASSSTLKTVTQLVPSPARRRLLDESLTKRSRKALLGTPMQKVVSALGGLGFIAMLAIGGYQHMLPMLVFFAVVPLGAMLVFRKRERAELERLTVHASTTTELLAAHRVNLLRIRDELNTATNASLVAGVLLCVMAASQLNEPSALGFGASLVIGVSTIAGAVVTRKQKLPQLSREIADLSSVAS